jgi:hypothetical protein
VSDLPAIHVMRLQSQRQFGRAIAHFDELNPEIGQEWIIDRENM